MINQPPDMSDVIPAMTDEQLSECLVMNTDLLSRAIAAKDKSLAGYHYGLMLCLRAEARKRLEHRGAKFGAEFEN